MDVTFFVESVEWGEDRGESLRKLFSCSFGAGTLVSYMAVRGWKVAMALPWLDDGTADAIRVLNEAHVPVTAWVVVDDLRGYWLNPASISFTLASADRILQRAGENDLQLEAIGFDLELPIGVLQTLAKQGPSAAMAAYLRFLRENYSQVVDAQQRLEAYINYLTLLKVPSEFYVFPRPLGFLGGGLRPPKGSRQIEMLYTSMVPPRLQSLYLRLARDKGAIPALGIVGGRPGETPGRYFGGSLPRHLTSAELSAAIRQVSSPGGQLYVFALDDLLVLRLLEVALPVGW